MSDDKKRYEDVKRPTVLLTKEQHKKLKILCAEHDIKIQDFLTDATVYFLDKGALPPRKKV